MTLMACVPPGQRPEETILYSRDAAGRPAEVITPEGKTQYAYDKSGRLTGIFSPDGTSQRTGL